MNSGTNKKFTVRIVLVFVVILVLFCTTYFINRSGSVENKKSNVGLTPADTKETISGMMSKDSDGDGLYDWEEALWNTDPNKASTLENGLTDKQWVDAKRQTLKNDGVLIENTEDPNLNETDRFNREFFTTFMALKQSGNLTPEAIANIASQLSKYVETGITEKIYSLSDLRINNNLSTSDYSKNIDAIFIRYAGKNIGDEMDIMKQNSSESGSGDFSQIKSIADAYTSLGNEVLLAETSENFSINHLNLANSLLNIGFNLNIISMTNSNPIKSMPAMSKYIKWSDILSTAIQNLEDLKNN